MTICSANTSPLIALSSIRRLDLLRAVFPQVLVPEAAYGEVVTYGEGWIEARQLQGELAGGEWLLRTPVAESPVLTALRLRLGGSGEAEAIVLAKGRCIPVLLDELAGRKMATALGVEVLGSLRILRLAKKRGLVPQIRPLLMHMIEAGIYYGDDLVERFLREEGEI